MPSSRELFHLAQEALENPLARVRDGLIRATWFRWKGHLWGVAVTINK